MSSLEPGDHTREAREDPLKAGSYAMWHTGQKPNQATHIGTITSTTKNTAMVRYGSGNKQQHRRFGLDELQPYAGHAKGKP